MWIRSQNKEVFMFTNNFNIKSMTNETFHIVTYDYSNTGLDYPSSTVLGKYGSKEEAMKVLNDIQNKIGVITTYQMPKWEE